MHHDLFLYLHFVSLEEQHSLYYIYYIQYLCFLYITYSAYASIVHIGTWWWSCVQCTLASLHTVCRPGNPNKYNPFICKILFSTKLQNVTIWKFVSFFFFLVKLESVSAFRTRLIIVHFFPMCRICCRKDPLSLGSFMFQLSFFFNDGKPVFGEKFTSSLWKFPFSRQFTSNFKVLRVQLSQPHWQQLPSDYRRFYIHFMAGRQINPDWFFLPLLTLPLNLYFYAFGSSP